MTERWRAEAKKVVLEVRDAMQFQDEQGAVEFILELIERVEQETWQEMNTLEFPPHSAGSVAASPSGERPKEQCPYCKEWCSHGFCGRCERALEGS